MSSELEELLKGALLAAHASENHKAIDTLTDALEDPEALQQAFDEADGDIDKMLENLAKEEA